LPHIDIDSSVYRHNSTLRMIGQCKYEHGIYMKRLVPYKTCALNDLLIQRRDTDRSLSIRVMKSHVELHKTVHSHTRRCGVMPDNVGSYHTMCCHDDVVIRGNTPMSMLMHTTQRTTVSSRYKAVRTLSEFVVPRGLKLVPEPIISHHGSVLYRLHRVSRSFCVLCERTHDSDNAYLVVTTHMIEYRCFRGVGDDSKHIAIAYICQPMIVSTLP